MKKIQAFLILGFVVTLCLSIGFFVRGEKERGKRIETERLLMSSLENYDRLETEMSRLNKDLSDKLHHKEKAIGYLLAKLEKEKVIKEKLVSNIGRKTSRLADVGKRDVELEKIVVTSLSEAEGKILGVDTDKGVVVINLGSRDNVRLNDRFRVYREGAPIGSVELIQIQNQLSAASILSQKEDIKIAVNDSVKLF